MTIYFQNILERNKRMTNHKREQLIQSYCDWLNSKQDANEWTLFAFTVVFKPIDVHNSKARWESEYTTRVLNKFRKALERNPKCWSKAIPLDSLFYFERFETSKLRVSGSRSPFHIHSLLPIPASQVHRIFSTDTDSINKLLEKDLYSIDVVQNVLLEKITEGNSNVWLRYMSKGKEFSS
jgi:hypothetical protein